MILYQTKSRVKIIVLFFVVTLLIASIGIYFYFFRYKEPTHGIFVDNYNYLTREVASYGYLYKTP